MYVAKYYTRLLLLSRICPYNSIPPNLITLKLVGLGPTIGKLAEFAIDPMTFFFFFCVCYAPHLVGALTGIRMNSVSRWHHWFPRRYSQEGRARVDPGFVNADAILGRLGTGNQGGAFLEVEDSASDSKMVRIELESFFLVSMHSQRRKKWRRGLAVTECSLKQKARRL